MDELREELERGEGGEGLVTGLIKWLGAAANTAGSAVSPLQVRCAPRLGAAWLLQCERLVALALLPPA